MGVEGAVVVGGLAGVEVMGLVVAEGVAVGCPPLGAVEDCPVVRVGVAVGDGARSIQPARRTSTSPTATVDLSNGKVPRFTNRLCQPKR